MRALVAVLAAVLVLVRLPSLAEPAGADQGLYAYVGQRIVRGELPYVHAWDQKPPAIHYTYAAMYALWPDDAVVAAADLGVAVATALVLAALGGTLLPGSGAGPTAALLFLFLGNPAFGRLGGVRVRAQCETFFALAVAASLLLAARSMASRDAVGRLSTAASGVLLGLAVLYKYNAAAYAIPILAALVVPWTDRRLHQRSTRLPGTVPWLAAGVAVPVVGTLVFFALNGALRDLYDATITYNLRYSGETYDSPRAFLEYLVTFPVRYAWLDSLWWMGGLASVVLLLLAIRRPRFAVAPIWVAAACLSIAINGSRGLPQYFVQASPALALAVGLVLALVWQRLNRPLRVALIVALAIGTWRVTNLPKAADYAWHDIRYLSGRLSEREHLARFGNLSAGDKYSALAIHDLADYFRANSAAADPVLLFGFSPGALVKSERSSATRFFWSRPVIVGFGEGRPGYGVAGLLDQVERRRPALVVLQRHDWDPDGPDSATFFLTEPRLAGWLRAAYQPAGQLDEYLLYRPRSSGAASGVRLTP